MLRLWLQPHFTYAKVTSVVTSDIKFGPTGLVLDSKSGPAGLLRVLNERVLLGSCWAQN